MTFLTPTHGPLVYTRVCTKCMHDLRLYGNLVIRARKTARVRYWNGPRFHDVTGCRKFSRWWRHLHVFRTCFLAPTKPVWRHTLPQFESASVDNATLERQGDDSFLSLLRPLGKWWTRSLAHWEHGPQRWRPPVQKQSTFGVCLTGSGSTAKPACWQNFAQRTHREHVRRPTYKLRGWGVSFKKVCENFWTLLCARSVLQACRSFSPSLFFVWV